MGAGTIQHRVNSGKKTFSFLISPIVCMMALAKLYDDVGDNLGGNNDSLDEQDKTIEDIATLRQIVEDGFKDKSATYNAVKHFSTRRVNRLVVEGLEKHTTDFLKLEELDSQLAANYAEFISKCDEEALEKAGDPLATSNVEALFEEYGAVKD